MMAEIKNKKVFFFGVLIIKDWKKLLNYIQVRLEDVCSYVIRKKKGSKINK